MPPLQRPLFLFLAALCGCCGQARGQADAAAVDAGVRKALEGIPEDLMPYVRLGAPASAPAVLLAEPLAAAVRLSASMDGDDDLRDSLLHQCGMVALQRGSAATAEEVAGQIRGHRAALLLVEVAEKLARTVEGTARARELVLKAGGMLPLLKPWQAQQVLARLLVAGKALGVPDTALSAWWDRLNDKEARVEVAVRLLARQAEEKGVFDMPLFQQEASRLGRGQPAMGFQQAAEDLLEQAERLLKVKDEARQRQALALVEAALEVLKASHTLHAELLVRWSARYFQAGREDLARQLFERAEKNLGAPHEQQARLYHHVARLWNLRGRAEVIRPRLEQVEKELSPLEQVYQPFICAWLSSAWEEASDPARAAAVMRRGVDAAATNENPRMRTAGAAAICLSRAATGRGLPESAAALAAELLGTTVQGTRKAASHESQTAD